MESETKKVPMKPMHWLAGLRTGAPEEARKERKPRDKLEERVKQQMKKQLTSISSRRDGSHSSLKLIRRANKQQLQTFTRARGDTKRKQEQE